MKKEKFYKVKNNKVEGILNLTQHKATPEQVAQGVVDLPEKLHNELTKLLTFEELPTITELKWRSTLITLIAKTKNCTRAMIGGAPYLMSHLEGALMQAGIRPLYAFSLRESKEEQMPDGSVKKINVFIHKGFVDPYGEENEDD